MISKCPLLIKYQESLITAGKHLFIVNNKDVRKNVHRGSVFFVDFEQVFARQNTFF